MVCKACDKALEEEGIIVLIYHFIICMPASRKYWRMTFSKGGSDEPLWLGDKDLTNISTPSNFLSSLYIVIREKNRAFLSAQW